MTKKDEKFIEQAMHMDCVDWMLILDMEDHADSEEARVQLSNIRKRLYHEEEGAAGLL